MTKAHIYTVYQEFILPLISVCRSPLILIEKSTLELPLSGFLLLCWQELSSTLCVPKNSFPMVSGHTAPGFTEGASCTHPAAYHLLFHILCLWCRGKRNQLKSCWQNEWSASVTSNQKQRSISIISVFCLQFTHRGCYLPLESVLCWVLLDTTKTTWEQCLAPFCSLRTKRSYSIQRMS